LFPFFSLFIENIFLIRKNVLYLINKTIKQPLKIKIMKNLNITKSEKTVLEIISWGDDYEGGIPTESFESIMDTFKGNENQLKGILSSLYKKKMIWISKFPNGLNSYHLEC